MAKVAKSRGKWRTMLHICFGTVWGPLAILITIALAVLVPGPVKMVPVIIFAGLLSTRVLREMDS
jgi:hypothetical protein